MITQNSVHQVRRLTSPVGGTNHTQPPVPSSGRSTRILEQTDDVREYTDAKTDVIASLAHRGTDRGELG
jgi:hypothetical protein